MAKYGAYPEGEEVENPASFAPPSQAGRFQRFPRALHPEGLPASAHTARRVGGIGPIIPHIGFPVARIRHGQLEMPGAAENDAHIKPSTGVQEHPDDGAFNELHFTLAAGQSLQLLASDPGRTYFICQNQEAAGGNDLRVAFGVPAGPTTGLQVIAGGNFEPIRKVPTNAVSVYSASGAAGTIYVASAGQHRLKGGLVGK